MTVDKKQSKLKFAFKLYRSEGFLVLAIRTLQKFQRVQHTKARNPKSKRQIIMLARNDDINNAEWTLDRPLKQKKLSQKKRPVIAWVMSPPGESGGGHQNIFRFMGYLDKKGYQNVVYLYSTTDFPEPTEIARRISHFYKIKLSNIKVLNDDATIEGADAVFATGWETAYPVYNASKKLKKFYFVQDFEPSFYPIGSESVLAENTYRFNFKGITAGRWLTERLSKDYGMDCEYYEFGADTDMYTVSNNDQRKEVFFYARPITPRRGFELGILALEKFHKMHPDYVINLAGWDVSEYEIPFPYVNHKALKLEELSEIYNRCAVALVLSLTNMSLLPLELLAAGTIPVVNDGPNNRLVSNNEHIEYAQASPDALATAMDKVVTRPDLPQYAQRAAKSVKGNGWDKSGDTFVKIVERELYG